MTELKAALPKSARFLLQQDTLQALNYPIFRCCFFLRAWRLSMLSFQLRKGLRHRVFRAGRAAGPAADGPRRQRCCEHTLHGEDRDQDVSAIESNRCKTQTQRSQTPKAPADIPSRETAEGSLCIQSSFSFSPQCIRDNLHLVEDSAVTAVALLLAAWMWEMETCPAHHRP